MIAAGAEDAADRARKAVLAAELRDQPVPGRCRDGDRGLLRLPRQPLAVAGRRLRRLVPDCAWPARTRGSTPATTPAWLTCTRRWAACAPSCRPPRGRRTGATPTTAWKTSGSGSATGPWAQGLARVTDADRELISHLLTGNLDT